MPNLTSGRNIGFKVGLQSTVNDIIAGTSQVTVVPGSFYLAEDTHRLYIGNDDLTLSPINEGITFVTNQSDLPTLTTSNVQQYAGQLYYITSGNILCMAATSGEKGGAIDNVPYWVQINPDTYLMSNTAATSVTAPSNGNNTVTVSTSVSDTIGQIRNNSVVPVHTVSGSFSIRGSENVTVNADPTTRVITISTPAGDIYHLNAAALDADDVGVDQSDRSNYVKLVLSSSSHDDEIIYVKKGSGNIVPTMGTGVTVDDVTYPVIELNGGGVAGSTIQLGLDANDKLTFTLIDSGNGQVSQSITPNITYGATEDANHQKVNKIDFTLTGNTTNGYTLTGDLDVYTTGEVDALIESQLQGFDAMYFAGTIGSSSDTFDDLGELFGSTAAQAQIKSGATYKFTQPISSLPNGMTVAGWKSTADEHGQTGAQIGDMIIVTGVEGADGYVNPSAATTKYTYIPSGDDHDIYYTPDFGTTAKTLTWTKSGNNGAVYQANFTQGTDIVVTGTTSAGSYGGQNQTINIAHASINTTPGTVAATNNTAQSQAYTAITGLTVSNGHVTAYETQQITLTHYRLTKAETTVTGGTETYTNSGKYTDVDFGTQYYTGNDTNGSIYQVARASAFNNNMKLTSSTLQFAINTVGSAPGGTGNQTPASIAIDMVWGSF